MTYQLIIPKAVEKQLNKLPNQIRETVIDNFLTLQDNPRPWT
jgi:mRNA-degrading endonuclease RelE of RelBE toxin-antitoxin system